MGDITISEERYNELIKAEETLIAIDESGVDIDPIIEAIEDEKEN